MSRAKTSPESCRTLTFTCWEEINRIPAILVGVIICRKQLDDDLGLVLKKKAIHQFCSVLYGL